MGHFIGTTEPQKIWKTAQNRKNKAEFSTSAKNRMYVIFRLIETFLGLGTIFFSPGINFLDILLPEKSVKYKFWPGLGSPRAILPAQPTDDSSPKKHENRKK